MKTITLENGQTVEISNESYENLAKAVKPEFKVGDWVYWSGVEPVFARIHKIGSKTGSFPNSHVLDVFGNTDSHDSCSETRLRLATPEEIKAYLIKEAERRGYKAGVEYMDRGSKEVLSLCMGYSYYINGDYLTDGYGGAVYQFGKWAEIIEDNKIKLSDNYEAEILDNGDIKVGCQNISFDKLKEVYKAAKAKRNE